ncbi:hypothetical protein C0991_003435 [Blastosporella zonata]|nr:hypothetical protein C0991_003435 [Blastosporella zonata]
MRVSVPGLPQAILSAVSSAKPISSIEATSRLAEFLGKGNATVLTGAGVSVDSGIRAYRGNDGRYMNPNYNHFNLRALECRWTTPKGPASEGCFSLGSRQTATSRLGAPRDFTHWLSTANPRWKEFADEMERTSTHPRTNPDGDVAVEGMGISYNDYVVPDCPLCLVEHRKNNIVREPISNFS